MKKNLFVAMLFTVSLWSQEKPVTTDIQVLSTLKKGMKTLYKASKELPLLEVKDRFHLFSGQLKKTKKSIKYKNTDLYKAIDSVHAEAITFLMGSVLYPLGEIDSIIYYDEYLKKNIPIDSRLARSARMAVYAKFIKSDFLGAVQSQDEAYTILKKSNSVNSQYLRVTSLLDFAEFYLRFDSFYNAEATIKLAELELKEYEKNQNYKGNLRLRNLYAGSKLSLLNMQGLDTAFVAFAQTVNLDSVKTLSTKYFILNTLIQFNLKKNNLEAVERYYKKLYRSEEFKDFTMPTAMSDSLSLLANIAIKKGDFEKANTYIFNVMSQKEKNLPLDFLLLKSKYYEQTGDYKKAHETFVAHTKKIDSLNTINKKFTLDVANYKISKEAETIRLNNENTEKSDIINKYVILTTCISVLLAFFIFLYFYRKQKHFKAKLEFAKQQEITALKSTFLENMSHEIRTPITSIIGYLVLLKEHMLDPEKTKRYLNLTLRNSEKMISSLNNFLVLLKSEKTTITAQKITSQKVNLFLKEITSFFTPDFKIKGIEFYYKTNILNSLTVAYDFESLKTIVTNLISNSIKYSNANAKIYCTVDLTDTHLNITIRDTGFGVSDEEKEKIFTRFYQSTRNTNISGYGIGLSLVALLIKNLEGTITLESEINVGSIFHVALPLKVQNLALNVNAENIDFERLTIDNDAVAVQKIERRKKPKVLIVEDSTEMNIYLQELFTDELDCTYAFNGEEALSKIAKKSFDLIISDLRMPLLDGIQLKEKLNKIEMYRDIPFILITATYQNQLEEFKTQLGTYEYIEKPFTKNEILSRVQFALERSIYKKEVFAIESRPIDFDGSETKLIYAIRECILTNLTNTSFTSKMLAKRCGYQQKQLNHILQTKLGLSIVKVILEVRLLKAYDAIVKKRFSSLNEVMFASGISSRSYFNKTFQKRFGITPGNLRRKYSL